MSAIRFLTALAKSVHSKLFSDDSTLKQVTDMPHARPLRASQMHPRFSAPASLHQRS